MLDLNDLRWLAGWLEGEGCFSLHKQIHAGKLYQYPRIVAGSTDKDVLQRVAQLLGVKVLGPYLGLTKRPPRKKPFYECSVTGTGATEWMMTLYTLMGQRRKARIREVLAVWREGH